MVFSLKHGFTSAKADGVDPTLVQPSNWNAEHTITMATAKVLGRATAGNGAVEELPTTGTGSVVLATNPNIVGTATNDSAAAGSVGELVSSTVTNVSPVSLSSGVSANITTISLTAGDWEVYFLGGATGTATLVQRAFMTLSTTSATLGSGRDLVFTASGNNTNYFTTANLEGTAGPARLSLSSTTTIYAVMNVGFSGGTCGGYGILRARRVR